MSVHEYGLPTARAGFRGMLNKAVSRYSFITAPWTGVRAGRCKPTVGIRKLECMQMQVVQRLAIVAASRAQEPTPERTQMLPPRAQMLMAVIGHVPQLAQPQLCNDAGNLVGHCKERSSESGVLPGGAPRNDKRIPHQLDGRLAQEQAHRARCTAVPRRLVLRMLPPGGVAELNVREQERAMTRQLACGAIETHPKIPVHPHHLGHGAAVVLACGLRQLLDEQLVEFMNEFEEGATSPRRDRH